MNTRTAKSEVPIQARVVWRIPIREGHNCVRDQVIEHKGKQFIENNTLES